ncbi:hypothetical protein C8R45DRAFT_1101634 [Mycena sanguinolenta]|nr:hypothetical protein C8R45DRAFT_1101634 [Mycena sanguinolenta]
MYLGRLGTQATNSTWRYIKVIGDYAYIGSEALGQGSSCAAGLIFIDVTDPTAPTSTGCARAEGYVHNAQCLTYHGPQTEYVGTDVCYTLNESAAPAALCTLTNFVADIRIYATEIQDPQSLMVGFITTLMIPQLYAWSAMWTLNSREDIRAAVDNRPYTTINLGTSVAASADSQTENTPRVGENGTDIATCSTLFLQGVLCVQFAHYTNFSQRDSKRLKFFVTGLAFITTLKSAQALAMMWIQNVLMFGNVEVASQMWERHWLVKINRIFEATAAFYVQLFFCVRLWVTIRFSSGPSPQHLLEAQVISRNKYLVIVCIILFTTGLVSAIVSTFFIFAFTHSTFTKSAIVTTAGWVSIHLGIVLSGDLLLTGSTVFYLLRYSNASVLSRGPFAITVKSLLRLTVQAINSFPPASLLPADYPNNSTPVRSTNAQVPQLLLIAIITVMVLPQLYAWSAMWTLNSREEILFAAENFCYTVNLGTSMAIPSVPEASWDLPGESGTTSHRWDCRHVEPGGNISKLRVVVQENGRPSTPHFLLP